MTEDEFWTLIDHVDVDALRGGDDKSAAEPLIQALAPLGSDIIYQFEEQLAQVLYRLDGERFADNAGRSGQSGDGFLYARCFVVGCGREEFQAVLANPENMPTSLDDWFEPLLFAGENAWALSTGSDPEDFNCTTSVCYETGSNESQW